MLAPTTVEHATVHTVDSRSDALQRLRVAALLWLLLALAATEPLWRRRADRVALAPPDVVRSTARRRGPPLRIA